MVMMGGCYYFVVYNLRGDGGYLFDLFIVRIFIQI